MLGSFERVLDWNLEQHEKYKDLLEENLKTLLRKNHGDQVAVIHHKFLTHFLDLKIEIEKVNCYKYNASQVEKKLRVQLMA